MQQQQQHESSLTSYSNNNLIPFIFYLGKEITPESLLRVRQYIDLISNPPPPPHPFGVFLEEAARLKNSAITAANNNNFTTSIDTTEEEEEENLLLLGSKANTSKDNKIEIPSLLELLRISHGYASGSALYRLWVQDPQEYLSYMAERISKLILTRVLPLIINCSHETLSSYQDKSLKTNVKEEKILSSSSSSYCTECFDSNRYNIHVRFLPSSAPSVQVSPTISQAFCAEIIIRDVRELRRREEEIALMRAQYILISAEGQTVQNSLAFWKSIKKEAAVEEDDKYEEKYEKEKGEENETIIINSNSSAVVLGQTSEMRGGNCVWMQPNVRRSRYIDITNTNNNNNNRNNKNISDFSRKRKRGELKSETGESIKAPGQMLQSKSGLVAVFYLAFSGALYTGTLCNMKENNKVQETKQEAMKSTSIPIPLNSKEKIIENLEEIKETVSQNREPIFFLPCAASTSFVRGLLGL